jgi:hypothetical protein
MDRGRVGEDRGSKETDGCPLTLCMHSKLHWINIRCIWIDPCGPTASSTIMQTSIHGMLGTRRLCIVIPSILFVV